MTDDYARERAERAEQESFALEKIRRRRRELAERCACCGGSEFVDAVDNHGLPYRGCARCIITLPA